MLLHSNRWTMVYIGGHWTLVYSKGKAWKSFFGCLFTCFRTRQSSVQQQPGNFFLVLWNFWWKAHATFSAENSVITLDFLLCSPCGTPMPLLRWEWSAPGAGWTRRGRYLSAQCWKYKSSAFMGFENTFTELVNLECLILAWDTDKEDGWYEALWLIQLHTLTHR